MSLSSTEILFLFSEFWIHGTFSRLHPERSRDRLQAYGHPNPASTDCHQEVYAQTSNSWGSLIYITFSFKSYGQDSNPHGSSAGSGLLCYSINPKPAHLQCPSEVGSAWTPASSPWWAQFWPAAHSQPRAGAVHARSAQRSWLCLWPATAWLLPNGTGAISRTAASRCATSKWNKL